MVPDFNVFFRYNATYPYYSDAIWYLTQMRRWGQIREDKPDSWYLGTAKKVYRPDIYQAAAESLINDKLINAEEFSDFTHLDGFKAPQTHLIDGNAYNGKAPNAYISTFTIGLKQGDRI